MALSELAYDYDSHPLTIVLQSDATAAVSATEDSGYSQAYPETYEPAYSPVTMTTDGFESAAPQEMGWLAVESNGKRVLIELDNLSFSVSADDDCSSAIVVVSATIPASEGDTKLDTGKTKTITELATGSKSSEAPGWPVKIVFEAVSIDFGGSP